MLSRRQEFIITALDVLTRITADLNEADKISYAARLNELRTRFYDPEFRLAIVGNFSCGKSTFLNALLKRNLLKTDILPTTAIPTYIRWNKAAFLRKPGGSEFKYCNPIITLTMTDGKIYTLTRSGKISFEQETALRLPTNTGEIIDVLTTTNTLIGKIRRVELTFPERRGFENFCLIDTPGINPGDEASKQHILQTQQVIREDADAVILLYPATQTMTRDTEEFMRDNASHLRSDAIIILTKIDLIPKVEAEKIIKYTGRLVKNRFNQSEPKIYTVSAQQASNFFSGNGTDEESAKSFDDTLNEIIAQLSDRRLEIISRRLSELIGELMDSISRTITSDLSDLQEKRVTLKKYSAENLEKDFSNLVRDYEKFFAQNQGNYLKFMTEKVRAVVSGRREKIFQRIDAADNVEETDECLKTYYQKIMADCGKEILEQLNTKIAPPINRNSKAYAEKLAEYLNLYERYLGSVNAQAVTIKSEQILSTVRVAPAFEESFADKISNMVSYFKNNFDAAPLIESLGSALNAAEGWIDDKFFSDVQAAKVKKNVVQSFKNAKSWFSTTFSLEERTTKVKESVTRNLKDAGDWISNKMLANRKSKAKEVVDKNLNEYATKLIALCTESITRIICDNLTWARNLLSEYKASYRETFYDIEKQYNERVTKVEAQIIRHKENRRRIEDLKEQAEEI